MVSDKRSNRKDTEQSASSASLSPHDRRHELDRSINPVNAAANLPRSLVAAGLTHRTGLCQFEPSLWIRILEIAISRPETGPQKAAEIASQRETWLAETRCEPAKWRH